MDYDISKDLWHTCRLCGLGIKCLAKKYGGEGIYYTNVFRKHLEVDHNKSLEKYFTELIPRPVCHCGICNNLCDITMKGSKFFWRQYNCGRNAGIMKWSKEAKTSRKGDGNPMFQAKPWNKGLDASRHPSLLLVSEKMTGRKVSKSTKSKQKNSALKRTIHGHTGCKHSKKNKELFRQNTLKMIADGKFSQTKTKPHLIFLNLLKNLNVIYQEEKILSYWSFDFYLPEYDTYIEIDGDYWHSNPIIFKNGPKTKSQKINFARDISKNKFCVENDLKLIRIWEFDIINNVEEVEEIICKLKES